MPPHQLSASLEPKSIPIPHLKSKNGKGFPEEGEVGDKGLWFRRAPREAKKTLAYLKRVAKWSKASKIKYSTLKLKANAADVSKTKE